MDVKLGQWDVKHKQDMPFMAFGSMMNAYGQLNNGKETSVKDLLKIADEMFDRAKKYADDTLIVVQQARKEKEQVDIPLKEE